MIKVKFDRKVAMSFSLRISMFSKRLGICDRNITNLRRVQSRGGAAALRIGSACSTKTLRVLSSVGGRNPHLSSCSDIGRVREPTVKLSGKVLLVSGDPFPDLKVPCRDLGLSKRSQ